MRFSNQGRLRQQVRFLRRQYLQDDALPFSDILTHDFIGQALAAVEGVWKDRIYTPLITLWVFLSQVLSPDHSCRGGVARLIAHRLSQGQRPCSLETGAYCQARMRLPEKFFSAVTCLVGRALDAKASSKWLWKGRRVYMFDGTTVNMPDTAANQKAYPQAYNQKPGLGFPIARVGALISLSCGAILNLGICRYAGKGQGEVSLLRQLWDVICPGEVLLTDCLMANWLNMFLLQQRGIELVSRLNKANRRADFRRGKRLDHHDHIVHWYKPSGIRSLDWKTYHTLPEYITIREALVRVTQPGFRTKTIVVVTTLLDHLKTTLEDLATLYRSRWNNELDLRSLKCTMQMDNLRCKTPEQVRKEIWTHMLAYNLIRTIMAQAAATHGLEPRSISFKGACQMLEAFQPLIELQAAQDREHRLEIYHHLLDAIASQRVADRPNRFEPRMKKQRPDHYRGLMRPRAEIKRLMAKGFRNI
jgi:Transposase DDE domain